MALKNLSGNGEEFTKVARKSQFLAVVAVSLALSPAAFAQSNPFQRPTGGGLSKAEVQRIVAEEAAKKNGAPGAPTGDPTAAPGTPGAIGAGTGSIPSQPAPPITNAPPAGMAPSGDGVSQVVKNEIKIGGATYTISQKDPLTAFFTSGGEFKGCAGGKPIFAIGNRRFYFTAKELKKSYVSRFIVRC